MKIKIEDYFGSDVLTLDFKLKDKEIKSDIVTTIEDTGNTYGYNVADVDEDDNEEYLRLQQINVDNTKEEERKDLIKLVNELIIKFL